MKILHIGQMIGGLDIYIRNSIIYNKVESNEYVIVCGRDDKHQPVVRNGIAVKEYPISLFRSLNPVNDLKALIQAVKIIKKEKPDVIHCHSAKGGIIGRTAGWITGVKTFYTPHAFILPLDAEAYAEKIIQLVNDQELRMKMEKNSRDLFLREFFIENRISYLQNQYEMVMKKHLGGVNLILLNTSVDTVVQVSIGYHAALQNEERRVAA